MRIPRLLLLLATLALVVLAVACGSDDESADASAPAGTGTAAPALETIESGRLTVCTDAPYPPFEYEENGEYTGFDMELLRAIGGKLGLELAVTVQPFDGIWLAPASGKCDIVASAMTITPERQANALFSEPYFDADQSLLVRAEDADRLTGLEALEGAAIGVQSGTTGATYARENLPEGGSVREFDEPAALFPALASGQIDAILQDFPVNLDRANKDDAFAVTAEIDTGESYGFAVAKDDTALKQAVDTQLAALRADGTYDEIYNRFFPKQ
jgi:polar amino acid transport system substrate-binding protein